MGPTSTEQQAVRNLDMLHLKNTVTLPERGRRANKADPGPRWFVPPAGALRRYLGDPLYRNSAFLIFAGVLGAPLGFAFWILVARLYSPSEVGLASAIVSAGSLMAVMSSLGFDTGIVRFLPLAERKTSMVTTCLTVAGVSSLVLAVAFVAGIRLWSPALVVLQQKPGLGVLTVVFTVATALLSMQRNAFIAMRSGGSAFVQDLLWLSLKLAMVAALSSLGLYGIVAGWSGAVLIALAIGSLLVMRLQSGYRPFPGVNVTMARSMLRFSLVNHVGNILSGAPVYLLPLIVVNALGTDAGAYFYIAYGIAALLFTVPTAISQSLFVEGSFEPARLRQNTARAAKLTTAVLAPLIVVFMVAGGKLLLLFGRSYSENATSAVRILALSSIPLAFNYFYIATKRVRLEVRAITYTFLGLTVVTIGLSYVMMLAFGLTGVALGWAFGQTAVAVVIAVILIAKAKPRHA